MEMVNQPGMPANPGPADIARYNAWAVANNQPLFGAAGVAAAVPVPPMVRDPLGGVIQPATRNGARAVWNASLNRWELLVNGNAYALTGPRGTVTQEGHHYLRAMRRDGAPHNLNLLLFRPGVEIRGNAFVAKTLTGREVVVSRWDAHRQQYIANRYGVAYFNVFKVQFNVNVPAFRIVRSRTAPYRLLRCTPFVNEWLVLDEPELLTHIGAEVANFRYVSANATLDQQHQWIRNAFNAYIADLPTEDGFAILTSFFDSDTGFAYDTSRQPTFDEQVTHVHRPGPTATELILNRPLQGIVIVPEDMYAKTGF